MGSIKHNILTRPAALVGWLIIAGTVKLSPQSNLSYQFLADEYEQARFSTQPLDSLKVEHVTGMLRALADRYPDSFHYEVVANSVEKRPIHLVKLGAGDTKVLLWSQMHGDEPTATAALFDVFNYLMMHHDNEFASTILDNITIYAVPMLNPDGAHWHRRQNAQGLDINRDARDLQSPEGQLLFRLKDELQPDFGFNLHDQNARRTVGNTGKLAAIALMAPPFDRAETDNPVRLRAKQVAAIIYSALGPEHQAHISKYDAGYMPRAFGDSMQNWGISTVLIESGGWHTDADRYLQKLNFIALLAAFHAIADGSYSLADPAVYDALEENGRSSYDLIIRDVMVIDGTGIPPFRADVAVNYLEGQGTVVDLGDLDVHSSNEMISGDDLYLAPGLIGMLKDINLDNPKPLKKVTESLLQRGFTTLLFSVPETQIATFEATDFLSRIGYRGNSKVVLQLDTPPATAADKVALLGRLASGPVGLLLTSDDPLDQTIGAISGMPIIQPGAANFATKLRTLDPSQVKSLTSDQARQWQLPGSGTIRKGEAADFVLLTKRALGRPKVQAVYVSGHRVWPDGD